MLSASTSNTSTATQGLTSRELLIERLYKQGHISFRELLELVHAPVTNTLKNPLHGSNPWSISADHANYPHTLTVK